MHSLSSSSSGSSSSRDIGYSDIIFPWYDESPSTWNPYIIYWI